jgi:hypothetical protein
MHEFMQQLLLLLLHTGTITTNILPLCMHFQSAVNQQHACTPNMLLNAEMNISNTCPSSMHVLFPGSVVLSW